MKIPTSKDKADVSLSRTSHQTELVVSDILQWNELSTAILGTGQSVPTEDVEIVNLDLRKRSLQ